MQFNKKKKILVDQVDNLIIYLIFFWKEFPVSLETSPHENDPFLSLKLQI